MVCRKRRRRRLADVVSCLCTFVGLAFVGGNVFMLREGFVRLYATALGEYRPQYHRPAKWPGGDQPEYRRHHRLLGHRPLPLLDSPRVELPSSALAAELHFRKLAGERRRPRSGFDHAGVLDADDAGYLRRNEVAAARRPRGVALVAVPSRDLRRILRATSDCVGLAPVAGRPVVGSGWTKVVYGAVYDGRPVALKTVDTSGRDLVGCLKAEPADDPSQCYENVVRKLLREIVLLRGFDCPHIVQIVAHCVPEVPFDGRPASVVTMATELGESLDIIKLLHLSWEDRLKISYGLCKLLDYLAHSPYGSAIVSDFRRQQFVLIDGDIKLTDVDDIGFNERRCLTDSACQQHYSSVNRTLRTKCIAGQCLGLNEKINIFNAARHFTAFLLPHGAPRPLRAALDRLANDFMNVTKTSRQLLQDITIIIDDYSRGVYLNRTDRNKTVYRLVSGSDMPGKYDYSCQYCMDGTGCTVSVYDVKEAEQFCDADRKCRAFVFTNTRTWTGRFVAHLKNGIGSITKNDQTSLYIKPYL